MIRDRFGDPGDDPIDWRRTCLLMLVERGPASAGQWNEARTNPFHGTVNTPSLQRLRGNIAAASDDCYRHGYPQRATNRFRIDSSNPPASEDLGDQDQSIR